VTPKLVAITDLERASVEELVTRSRALCSAATPGSLAVLLRDHRASARVRLELGRQLREVTRSFGQSIWVADRLDLALSLQADGLHLGEGSVSARDARALLPPGTLVSRACHELRPANDPELAGVDALLLSPVLEPRKGRPALGLEALATFTSQSNITVLALGGVTAATAAACLVAGARGVAAMGAAWSDDAPALLRALGISR
jgi:thiamine-phosphate diphosphorylase